ncbi:unnamed protein product [Caenorhabditis sp. 36 PRJEB53466]|nr:unnamed protein product [Caenorhabditis sp. 36 PRJEB53466]
MFNEREMTVKLVRTSSGEEAEEPASIPAKRPRMTVDEPIDDVGRKGKKGRAGVMSVAERLQSQAQQLSPNSQADPDEREDEYRPVDLKLGTYDKATIRVIAQFLDNIGLQKSVETLVEETGFTIETSAGARIRANILRGNYDAASSIVRQSMDLDQDTGKRASFLIQCFKLADLVRKKRYLDALYTMQVMAPYVFRDETANLEYFDSFLKDVMLGGTRYHHVDAETSRNAQLSFLEELLPSDFILPQNRLKTILHTVHGPASSDKAEKLLRDEVDSAYKPRPYRCIQVWDHHTSPVYSVKFSRDGKLLASGGKSNSITLWKVNQGRIIRLGEMAPIAEGDIAYMEFCQRNKMLAVCGGQTTKFNLTVFNLETRLVYRTLRVHDGHDEIQEIGSFFTCFSFLSSIHNALIVAGNELGALKIYNLNQPTETPAVNTVHGFRVRCIYGMKDGDRFIIADAHNRVRIFSQRGDPEGSTICKEEVTILNMVVHPCEKLVLTTTDCNLRLWDIRSHNLIRVFSGACQREEFARFSIHASFGGVHMNHIATGSIGKETEESMRMNDKELKKNGRVVVWSVDESRPKYVFVGHVGHVNAVAWSPVDPTMLVSCGDDSTVRVWNLNRSSTSDYSEVVPRMITRKQKYPRRDDDTFPSTSNGFRYTPAMRAHDMLMNMTLSPSQKPKSDFVQDLDMEKMWLEKANRPKWRTQDDHDY